MNMTPGFQLRALTNGWLSPDKSAVGFRVERHDDTSLDIWCPVAEIGDFIRNLCHLAAASVPRESPHPTNQFLAPIPAMGMGFQSGETPNKTLLVMRLRGIDLAFEVASSGLAALADDVSRIARTLSADPSKPQ